MAADASDSTANASFGQRAGSTRNRFEEESNRTLKYSYATRSPSSYLPYPLASTRSSIVSRLQRDLRHVFSPWLPWALTRGDLSPTNMICLGDYWSHYGYHRLGGGAGPPIRAGFVRTGRFARAHGTVGLAIFSNPK